MGIEKDLRYIIDNVNGNNEIALFYYPDYPDINSWEMHVGNPSSYVMLGEVNGKHVAVGKTIRDVVSGMKQIIMSGF